jgi:hypothetical protein
MFLKPIFKNITDFLNYDESNQIISACFEYLQMNLKKKESEGKVASKIVKKVLRQHFSIGFFKEDLDKVLSDELEKMMKAARDGFKLEQDTHQFEDRYTTTWSYLHVMDAIFFMLERGKKYKLAALCLCCLL